MSVLAPLYILGALAISLPILLHLIRRTPRGRREFSSLMFLSPSPPRITRRSRIEHWLLLLLRAAAICLMALAFARPFMRETALLIGESGPGKRAAIVIDTSASMQRGDLWRQAIERVDALIRDSGPTDQISLYTFDQRPHLIVDWNEPLSDSASRQTRLRAALSELKPGWGKTDLGNALVTVAERIVGDAAEQGAHRDAEIILVSDCQQGADTTALRGYPWPPEVLLRVERLASKVADNASLRVLASDEPGVWRVRVANTAESVAEQFEISWGGGLATTAKENSTTVYVPAGQSRIVRMAEPSPNTDRVLLSGDAVNFDNEFYIAPVSQQDVRVVYTGVDSAEDVSGLRYFFERVWTETPRRKVRVESATIETLQTDSKGLRPLVVVASPIEADRVRALSEYVNGGGSALLVVSDANTASSLASLTNAVRLLEADSSDPKPAGNSSYALLGEINFKHPVFASFASPQYNDFTKVRIWKHQRFELDPAGKHSILARFDNGDPAIWEQSFGEGKLLWLACGWRPSDSQLALSSKFVPFLSSTLDHLTGGGKASITSYQVDDRIEFSPIGEKLPVSVTKPDGTVVMLDSSTTSFDDAVQPGVYRANRENLVETFAVNLNSDESNTAPLPADHFEELGVQIGSRPSAEQQLARQRQMRDIELESRQKLWKWMLVGVLGVLAVETCLAGRLARRTDPTEANHD